MNIYSGRISVTESQVNSHSQPEIKIPGRLINAFVRNSFKYPAVTRQPSHSARTRARARMMERAGTSLTRVSQITRGFSKRTRKRARECVRVHARTCYATGQRTRAPGFTFHRSPIWNAETRIRARGCTRVQAGARAERRGRGTMDFPIARVVFWIAHRRFRPSVIP